MTALSVAVPDGVPPAEFRIFTAGQVETVKGSFVFDELAAAMVMSEYRAHGIDLMVDYDHAALGSVADPALAGRAAGWFEIELRGGELWAVNVRWTAPAAEALRQKEWRFMSPAFTTDESGKITSLLNVALTNLPATRKLEPLVAASGTYGETMTADLMQRALDAIANNDLEAMAAILKEFVTMAATGEAAPASPSDSSSTDAAPADTAVVAAASRLVRLTGKANIVAALEEAEVWRASHLELETERQKLATERALLEAAERRRGCVELVTLAGRAPATVWSDDTASQPKRYLASMPIADFREYVADAVRASGSKRAPKAPVAASTSSGTGKEFQTPTGPVMLSAREIAECEQVGAKPEIYAANKALFLKARGAKE